jgi:site-specific recombinase XerC
MTLVPIENNDFNLPLSTRIIKDLVGGQDLPIEVFDELRGLLSEAEDLVIEATASGTRRSYHAHWRRFARWAYEHSIDGAYRNEQIAADGCLGDEYSLDLPVDPATVILYVTDWQRSAPAFSSINIGLSAIRWFHERNGYVFQFPLGLRRLLRGIKRRHGSAPKRKAKPLRVEHLMQIAEVLTAVTNQGRRDRLVVALRSCGYGWGEMVDLQLSEITALDDARTVIAGQEIAATGTPGCPVAALRDWLVVRGAMPGPLLVRIGPTDALLGDALARQTPGTIIRRLSRSAGITIKHGCVIDAVTRDRLAADAVEIGPKDLRDRAIILAMFGAGFRSDEVIGHPHIDARGVETDDHEGGLRIRDFIFSPEGVNIHIRQSKNDSERKGVHKSIPRGGGGSTDPVLALEQWIAALESAGLGKDTYIALAIDRHGAIIDTEVTSDGSVVPARPITQKAVTDLVRNALRRTGMGQLEAATFSSHSCKRGLATELANGDTRLEDIAEVLGNRSLETARGYVDDVRSMRSNPVRNLGL